MTQTPPPSSSTPASAPLPAALVMPSEMTHYVIPLGFAHRSAVALLRASLFTRSFTVAFIVVAALYLILMGLDAADIVESGALSWIGLIYFAFMLLIAVLLYAAQRRSTAALLPPGSTLSARFDTPARTAHRPDANSAQLAPAGRLVGPSGSVLLAQNLVLESLKVGGDQLDVARELVVGELDLAHREDDLGTVRMGEHAYRIRDDGPGGQRDVVVEDSQVVALDEPNGHPTHGRLDDEDITLTNHFRLCETRRPPRKVVDIRRILIHGLRRSRDDPTDVMASHTLGH